MSANRMTKQSVANIAAAVRAVLEPSPAGYLICLFGGASGAVPAWVMGRDGAMLHYASLDLAYRAVHRLRPDLPIELAPEI